MCLLTLRVLSLIYKTIFTSLSSRTVSSSASLREMASPSLMLSIPESDASAESFVASPSTILFIKSSRRSYSSQLWLFHCHTRVSQGGEIQVEPWDNDVSTW
jgi:hypothetical protein